MQAKGGSFAKDKDFFRFTIGNNEVIPAFEEAILSMKEGGIRRIVVPVELGYPDNDMYKKGPTPTTFSVSHFFLVLVARCKAAFLRCLRLI